MTGRSADPVAGASRPSPSPAAAGARMVDGGVWLPGWLCGRYAGAMTLVLAQLARHRPGGVVPAYLSTAQAVLELAADAADGTIPAAQAGGSAGSGGPLTVNAAADVLGVAPRTVRAWISAGKLPALRVGRVWLLSRVKVEAFRRRRQEDVA